MGSRATESPAVEAVAKKKKNSARCKQALVIVDPLPVSGCPGVQEFSKNFNLSNGTNGPSG